MTSLSSSLRSLDDRTSAGRWTRALCLGLLSTAMVSLAVLRSEPASTAPSAPIVLTADSAAVPPLPERLRALLPEPPAVVTPAPAPTQAAARRSQVPAASRVARSSSPAADRWLPTGTGMWLHDWRKSESGHAHAVVARAKAAGLSHLFVQTGSSKKGWIGTPTLAQLLPATTGTGIAVIAWDFPKLVNPEADARRLARAAWFHRPGAPMVAAVAPDVETAAEGTHLSARAIDRYYRTLRAALPARTAILATVPWPSEKRINSYPYDRTARHTDAWIPMAYWYNRDPARVTATSMRVLSRFGKPIMPVGQGYDGRLDAPYLAPDPTPGKSVQAFLDTARRRGAPAVSLWSWQTTGPQQWRTLANAAAAFAAPAPAVSVAPRPRPAVRRPATARSSTGT
ncbi:MAG TPA: hypothetical protein VNA30_04395 [Mycobacteriales bacterium]|nr:hypothetical protein [Mycobacteriales bacterium]